MKDYKLFFICALILCVQDMPDWMRVPFCVFFAVAGWAIMIMDWNKK